MNQKELIQVVFILVVILVLSLFSIFLNLIGRIDSVIGTYTDLPVMEYVLNSLFLLLTLSLWMTYRRWKEAAKKQEELENILSSISPHALIVTGPDGTIRMCNHAMKKVLGYEVDEVMEGKTDLLFSEAEPSPAPDEQQSPREDEKAFLVRSGIGTKKNGEAVPLEIISANLSGRRGSVMLLCDVSEQQKAEKKLATAVREAEITSQQIEQALEFAHQMAFESEIANNAKSEFLAKMSHEIRTPMNGVMGMTGLLLDTHLTTEQREYAETVRSSADALLAIINDILDFSKIEAGKMELEIISFDLRTSVEEVGDMLAQKAQEKGLELAILMNYDVPTRVKGDPGRLRQVLVNLVNNAIKFTEKGEVLIRVSLAELTENRETVRFEVVDTGVGIPADHQERLFRPFSQGDASTTRRYGGTGLGLVVSKQIVQAMGGRIAVSSEEGRGSTFTFMAVFERQLGESPAPDVSPAADIRGLRVLVVDDSATNRKVFREQLRGWGCLTEDAVNAHSALEMLSAALKAGNPFHLALVDFHMTGMTGEGLARTIKAEPAIADTALILLTSVPKKGDAAKMLDVGFDAYLTKPVKQSQLYESIAMVMGLSRRSEPARKRSLITQHTLKEAARARYKILIVEDNIVNQKVAARMLEKVGYRCDVAANGREAVEALSRIPYDLLFMDCQMPEMDGYEATRVIRGCEQGERHTVIIAMTANAMKGDRERCLEAGMDDYISKPVTNATLCRILEKYLTGEPETETVPQQDEILESKPVHIQRIQEISDGDHDIETELISVFISENERRFRLLEAAIRGRDKDQVRHEAHTIKGSSASAGAQGMQEMAFQLEQMGENGELDPAMKVLDDLKGEFEQVRHFFQHYIGSWNPAPPEQL